MVTDKVFLKQAAQVITKILRTFVTLCEHQKCSVKGTYFQNISCNDLLHFRIISQVKNSLI